MLTFQEAVPAKPIVVTRVPPPPWQLGFHSEVSTCVSLASMNTLNRCIILMSVCWSPSHWTRWSTNSVKMWALPGSQHHVMWDVASSQQPQVGKSATRSISLRRLILALLILQRISHPFKETYPYDIYHEGDITLVTLGSVLVRLTVQSLSLSWRQKGFPTKKCLP